MHLTWFDSNTWLIEIGDKRLLVDPWLVGSLVFGNLNWLIRGSHQQESGIPENIDLILLSQGLEDHAHPETLKQMSRTIPVVGSPNAAKVAQELGYTQVTAMPHGETFNLAEEVTIQATPGSPTGPTSVENGYLIKEVKTGLTIYYEPHGFHESSLQEAAPVDIVITPLINLSLPLFIPLIKGMKSALELAQWLHPQVILPTSAGGNVVFAGLLLPLLQSNGGIEEFRSLLGKHNLSTQVIEPVPGERFALQLEPRVTVST